MTSRAWYMYVLRCADDSLYCGASKDVHRRLRRHNEGKGAAYTRSRKPCELVGYWRYSSCEDAMSAEYQFKQLSREDKLRTLEEKAWRDGLWCGQT